MIQFTKPKNLNGTELLAELNKAGVSITQSPMVDGNDNLFLDVSEADKVKAERIVAAHNGTMIAPEATVAQKLTSVGLSIDDLKVALGL
jgi:hypothetical protein